MESRPPSVDLASAGWTLETLFVHFTTALHAHAVLDVQRYEMLETSAAKAYEAHQLALDKVVLDMQGRETAANEWRGALNDHTRLLLPRTEHDAMTNAMNTRLRELELANKDSLTRTEFQHYLERQEQYERDTRRARTTIWVGVGLSLFAAANSILIAILRH